MPEPAPPRRKLPVWKKALFSAVAFALFFVLLEAMCYLAGVQPALVREDPFLGFSGSAPLFVTQGDALETAPNKLRWFNAQRFSAHKAPGTVRIFCLGGSTTYGHPYEDPLSFCGLLREMLPAAAPGRPFEVVNAGGISYASYRISRLMEELAQYQPDLFVIYAGHNEFLERRTYADRIGATPGLHESLLARSRTFTALRQALGREPANEKGKPLLESEVNAILDASVGPKDYTRDDAWREDVQAHYRFHLERMIGIARAAGAKVLLVVPAANLKDCSPFKSEWAADLKGEDVQRGNEALGRARAHLESGRPGDALGEAEKALALDPRHAEALYLRGRALHALARHAEAKTAFQRARDEDICALRILSGMQETVREVARAQDVDVYDFAAAIEARSPHGIPDATFFLDHVHGNFEAYWMLAQGVLETMAERGLIERSPQWDEARRAALKQEVAKRLDRQTEGVALRNLAKVLSWAGKAEEAGRLAARAETLLGHDAESAGLHAAGAAAEGDLGAAIAGYRKALALDPKDAKLHYNLGVALQKAGETARATEHYAEALRLQPDFVDAAVNLAVVRHESGNLAEAIALYRLALKHKPDYAQAHANLGRALLQGGDVTEAAASFREALRLDAAYAPAALGMGDCLAAEGRFEEALAPYRQAAAALPEHEIAHCRLAAALAESGKLDEAIAVLRSFLAQQPEATEAEALLAVLQQARE